MAIDRHSGESTVSRDGGPAQRIALALLFAYAILLGGSWIGIYLVEMRILTLAVIAALLGLWLVAAIRLEAWRPGTRLSLGLVALAVAWAASTIASRYLRISLEYAAWAVLLVALYLLLVRVVGRPDLRRVLGVGSLGLAVTIAIAAIAQTVDLWVEWWTLLGRFGTPPLRPGFGGLMFGNPSAVLTITFLLWLASIALLAPIGRRLSLVVAAAALPVLAAAFLSGSRAGWLAIAVAVVVAAVAWLTHRGLRRVTVTRPRIIAGAILAVIVLIAAASFLPAVLSRVGAGGEDLRLAFYASALRMFASSPIVGTGPGTWVIQRAAFMTSSEIDYYIPHAHDVYVQVLAEFGVVGALAGIIAVAAGVALLGRAIRSSDPARRTAAWVVIVGTSYFSVHNILDSYANMPAVLIAWALPIAVLDAADLAATPGRLTSRLRMTARPAGALRTAGVAAVVIACVGLAFVERAAFLGDSAARAANGGNWPAAQSLARQALEADPAFPPYEVTLGVASAALGDARSAASAFASAAARDDLPESWLDLAAEQAQLGDTGGAMASLTAAMRLGREQPPVAVGAAVVYLRLGDRSAANGALVDSLLSGPSLAGDPGWRSIADAALGANVAIDAGIAAYPGQVAWEIAATSGRVERARAILTTIRGDDHATLALVTDALAGEAGAASAVIERSLARPFDRLALDWGARIATSSGRVAEAAAIRRLAFLATSDDTVGYALAVISGPHPGPSAGDRTVLYGSYTYRRLTPLDKLVGALPAIVFR